jgi:hypothetical protein
MAVDNVLEIEPPADIDAAQEDMVAVVANDNTVLDAKPIHGHYLRPDRANP